MVVYVCWTDGGGLEQWLCMFAGLVEVGWSNGYVCLLDWWRWAGAMVVYVCWTGGGGLDQWLCMFVDFQSSECALFGSCE